jgi:hypothetical protein
MEKISEHELLVELKTAITAEIERRMQDYRENNPCHRFDELYGKEYCISGEDLEEEAEEDSLQTFFYDLDDKFPKLSQAFVTIMRQDGYSI